MTDSELLIGLAFHGISCLLAFAVLGAVYVNKKKED